MQDNDRKLIWAIVVVFAVIALEIAWFLFVGPSDRGPNAAAQQQAQDNWPRWWTSEFWTAVFTGMLTLSTVLLWWTTRQSLKHAQADSERQSRETREQIELSRKQFIATHRPKMIVRSIQYENGLMNIVFVNTGTSDALIRNVYAGFGCKAWNGISWTNRVFKYVIRNDRIPTGAMIAVDPNEEDADFPMDRIANMSDRLFVFGHIAYDDENGTYRKMGFIRWYDVQFNRFELVPTAWADSEKEYAD